MIVTASRLRSRPPSIQTTTWPSFQALDICLNEIWLCESCAIGNAFMPSQKCRWCGGKYMYLFWIIVSGYRLWTTVILVTSCWWHFCLRYRYLHIDWLKKWLLWLRIWWFRRKLLAKLSSKSIYRSLLNRCQIFRLDVRIRSSYFKWI